MAEPNNQSSEGSQGGNTGEEDKPKSFSQEQLDEIVSKRLSEEKTKTEKTIAEKVAEAQAEAERKAKLSAEEREKEEKSKLDKQLSERETTLALREARIEARDILQSKGISTDLVDFIVDADIEKTKGNIDVLEKAFTQAVADGVAEKLKGKSPEDFSNNNKKSEEGKSTYRNFTGTSGKIAF